MPLEILNCPSCGAVVTIESTNLFSCKHCGSLSIYDHKNLEWKIESISTFTHCLQVDGINLDIGKVNSIHDIISLLKSRKWDISEIKELIANDNNISNLGGLNEFSSLKKLVLKNNKIRFIDSEIISVLKELIYSSDEFLLDLSQNFNLDYDFLFQLEIESNLTHFPFDRINIPLIENGIKELKNELVNCERYWSRSEQSQQLKEKYKTIQNYLGNNEKIIEKEHIVHAIFKEQYSVKYRIFPKKFILISDKSPFDLGINGYFESDKGEFYKNIKITVPKADIVAALTKKTGYDCSFVLTKRSRKEINEFAPAAVMLIIMLCICLPLTIYLFVVGAWFLAIFPGFLSLSAGSGLIYNTA